MTRGEQSTQRDGSKEDGVRRDAAGGQWGLLDHGKPQWGVRGHGLNDGSQRWRGKKREQLRGRASLGKQRRASIHERLMREERAAPPVYPPGGFYFLGKCSIPCSFLHLLPT